MVEDGNKHLNIQCQERTDQRVASFGHGMKKMGFVSLFNVAFDKY